MFILKVHGNLFRMEYIKKEQKALGFKRKHTKTGLILMINGDK